MTENVQYQGHLRHDVEAVVEATDVSIGPWMVNNLASMCVFPVLTLSTACSFYLLTNAKLVKADITFTTPCTYIPIKHRAIGT